ncbi:MAG: GTP diphosphokinase [Gammaproteobacteria bacterium]|nr:GTP diphosphokinase [Gammaproteobacteria bacterium]
MVQVRQSPDLDASGDIDVQRWVAALPHESVPEGRARLLQACEFARALLSNEGQDTPDWAVERNSFIAGLEIAQILADLHVDIECLVAGVLYRAVREQRIGLEAIEQRFGTEVSTLISDVLRMAAIGQLPLESEAPVLGQATDQKDNIRKMLIAMVDDVRVALIKLAERTCAIRAVKDDAVRRRKVAQEVFDIYAPLAHRLGIGQLKWELEDLSFRYIYADAYRKIARLLDGKRLERDRFIAAVRDDLSRVLSAQGLEFEIAGRSKHIYSIWRKMQRKGIGFSQVYDVRAVRILVPEIKDCYATLGLVHGLWRNIPNEFDDYIANPKENGYRSLHTAVIGPDGKVLEVQIRTHQMHQEAELGVCAHWRYKGADADNAMASTYEEKIAWLRHVLDWHDETGDIGAIAEQFSFEVAQDRVYVFTPDGDVVNLAQGATPLDFAYHVHTEIGHRCRGAKVNGVIVPLTYQLSMGERIEILTSKEAKPRRDWLNPSSGYLKTSRARAKVQLWFRGQAREDNIDAGRHLLEKELRDLSLTSMDYALIAKKMHFASVEDMYACVGSGDLGSVQVMQAARGLVGVPHGSSHRLANSPTARHVGLVQVEGVGSLMSHLAGCCKPVLGDAVAGFVTQGRGVSVHRADCARLVGLRERASERVVDVQWESAEAPDYEVDVVIQANDRQGLLRDITGLFANARINVLAIRTRTHKGSALATMRLRVEVPNLTALEKLFERILRLKDVRSAKRASS